MKIAKHKFSVEVFAAAMVILQFAVVSFAQQPIRIEISRDTYVSSIGAEADGNNGASPRLKTKGIQEFTLLDFDPKPLAGRVIASATLHLHCDAKDIQRRLTISTIPTPWIEGTAINYQIQKGSASFNWAAQNERPWAWPGSDITAVINGEGNTLWRFADATPPDADGWQTVAVSPDVLAARISGISQGLVVFDDVGSEYKRQGNKIDYQYFLNRFMDSRDQGKNVAPFLTVALGAEDHLPPDAPGPISIDAKNLPPGEAIASFAAPADHGPAGVLGFVARIVRGEQFIWDDAQPVPQYLVPNAAAPGQIVHLHLQDLSFPSGAMVTLGIRAVDRTGNLSAITKSTFAVSSEPPAIELPASTVKPFTAAPADPAFTIAVIDALDKIQPITGAMIPAHPQSYLQANHLWSAADKTIRLYAARNEFVDFQIVLNGKTPSVSMEMNFDAPATADANPRGQCFRFRHVNTKLGPLPDPLVPLTGPASIPAADENIPDQKFASFLGEIYIPHEASAGDHAGILRITSGGKTIELRIQLHVWNFTLPDYLSFIPDMNCYELPDAPDDLAYYRLAHVNRTCLNRLGYNWRGQVNDGCGPAFDGKSFTWEKYDHHFAPLLDGSAFADLPRKSVPVDTFYLPLNENWPADINRAFKGGYWPETAFDPAYPQAFSAAAALFAAHLHQKNWNDTFFEFYLNGKVEYKRDSWDRCSSPWIFDEPVNTQDFWALRYFGRLYHQGVDPNRGQAKVVFRCDVSRPQWQRDLLDNVMDVCVVGGDFKKYNRLILQHKQKSGQLLINYASSNPIDQPNTACAYWCIDAWRLGADGVLPWQTIGSDKSWTDADELSLFYPPKIAGLKEPAASVRLKSYLRGQQDVEYLTILSILKNSPRWQMAETIRRNLKSEDAESMWEFRMRIGSMLDALKPPFKRKWVDLRAPPRDMSALADLGQIAPTGR